MKNHSLSLIAVLFSAFCLIFLSGCKEPVKEQKPEGTDSVVVIDTVKPVKPDIKITYHKYPVEGLITLTELREKYGLPKRRIILALNRIDHNNLAINDTLNIPDTVTTDIITYSPFPKKIKGLDSIPKLLIFSYPIQAFAAYQDGNLVRWGATSLGKRSTPTPEGLYFTNWKSKKTISTDDSTWILPWYFNIENKRGISIHEFALPGYPASHACARLLQEDAEWIYYWAEQWIVSQDGEKVLACGTPVIVFGKYNYKEKPPWKKLSDNPNAANISETVIDSIVKPFIPEIKNRREVRDSIVAARSALSK